MSRTARTTRAGGANVLAAVSMPVCTTVGRAPSCDFSRSPELEMAYANVSKQRIALLELDEVEQCFRRLRPAAMQLGQENDIDSFASRVSLIRERLRSADAPPLEFNEMLEALKQDVQAFLKTLQHPH